MSRAFWAILLWCFTTVVAFSAWEEVTLDRVHYVTLRSFCEFYGFKMPDQIGDEPFDITGPYGKMTFRATSREVWLNNIRYWLSIPLRRDKDGTLLLPRHDLTRLFEPLLRPDQISGRQPVVGVIIDPGHGGADNGATARNGMMEKNLNLDTALRLAKRLEAAGIPCVMTRNKDVFITLEARAKLAEHYPGYIFVSIHYNQTSNQTRGIETYALTPRYMPSTSSGGQIVPGDSQNQPGNITDHLNVLLASAVHREVVKLHPIGSDRGVKRSRFVVLKLNSVPSILIEGGFLSSSEDIKLIASPEFRQSYAEHIETGIRKYMELMKVPQGQSPSQTPSQIFFRNDPQLQLRPHVFEDVGTTNSASDTAPETHPQQPAPATNTNSNAPTPAPETSSPTTNNTITPPVTAPAQPAKENKAP